MRSKIVTIGNMRGVPIPEPLIEEAGLAGTVNLRIVESGILIERAPVPRVGWEDDARLIRNRGDDGLLDEPTPTAFDDTGWVWV